MADAYAWSTIRYGGKVNENGVTVDVKTAKPGEKVSPSSLGIPQEEFNALVASGAVRGREFPKDLPAGMTPRQYYLKLVEQEGVTDQFAVTTGGSHMNTDDTLNYSAVDAEAAARGTMTEKKKDAPTAGQASK
jgi:hypothetical protein